MGRVNIRKTLSVWMPLRHPPEQDQKPRGWVADFSSVKLTRMTGE